MKLRIGTIVETGKPFLVDDSTLLETRILVVANSGGGKSFTFRGLNEKLNERIQCGVLDWKGEYASLRERFPYILCGGPKSEVPIAYHAARVTPRMSKEAIEVEQALEEASRQRTIEMAHLLLKLRDSFVIDLSALIHKIDRLAFAGCFLEAIGANAPKSLWRPMMVWIDEAHLLCPEKGDTSAKQAVVDVMALTRQRGVGGAAATQRLSKFDKDGEAECNNVLVGRTSLDGDLRRSCDLLGFGKDRWPDLKNLQPGQFFAFGPAFNVNETTLVQIDAVETTHPRPGRIRSRVRLLKPTAKLRRALAELGALPKAFEEKTTAISDALAKADQEIEMLRARVRELEAEMAKRKVQVEVEVEEKQVFRRGEVARLERALAKTTKTLAKLLPQRAKLLEEARILVDREAQAQQTMVNGLDAVNTALGKAGKLVPGDLHHAAPIAPNKVTPPKAGPRGPAYFIPNVSRVPPARVVEAPAPSGDVDERIIRALSLMHDVPVTRAQLAILSGYRNINSGNFVAAMGRLGKSGSVVKRDGGYVRNAPKTIDGYLEIGDEGGRIDFWAQYLEQREADALRILHSKGGKLPRVEIAKLMGYDNINSGNFVAAMGFMSNLDLTRTGAGAVGLASIITSGKN